MSATSNRPLPPAEIDCKWWTRGYCSRGSACYFKHDASMFAAETRHEGSSLPSSSAAIQSADTAEAPQTCAICLERPDTYGLLVNCDHAFCLECIRTWRASAPDNPTSENELKKTSKTCPMCRSQSDFIIPSSMWPSTVTGSAMKKGIVDRYLERLKTIPCKHFQRSIEESTPPGYKFKCQFGNHCHYSHTHPITKEPYIFSEEERQRRRKPRRRLPELDEMGIMMMLLQDLTMGYESVEEEIDDEDDIHDSLVFESEFYGLCDDFDDFDEFDYGWV